MIYSLTSFLRYVLSYYFFLDCTLSQLCRLHTIALVPPKHSFTDCSDSRATQPYPSRPSENPHIYLASYTDQGVLCQIGKSKEESLAKARRRQGQPSGRPEEIRGSRRVVEEEAWVHCIERCEQALKFSGGWRASCIMNWVHKMNWATRTARNVHWD